MNTCNPYQTDDPSSAPQCCHLSKCLVDSIIPSRMKYPCVVMENQSVRVRFKDLGVYKEGMNCAISHFVSK